MDKKNSLFEKKYYIFKNLILCIWKKITIENDKKVSNITKKMLSEETTEIGNVKIYLSNFRIMSRRK